ncbi:MAG TPA: metal-dependent hydrolase [Geminicoccaceae bacterium]|nr:metal-dependent hydrolase [Geminicoccaceae bacterium]
MQLTWLGHSACHLAIAGRSVLIDPFWTGNPKFPQGFEGRLERVDFIVLTHGHEDHLGDSARLAQKYGATLVAQFEICAYLGGQGVSQAEPMNIGGTVRRDGLAFTMVNALHSSAILKDGVPVTMGDPAGFVIKAAERTVYHAGDSEVFSDMALIQRIHQPTVGLIPIGDRFTMGPETAALACNEFLNLEIIVPIHWGTFDLLTGDPESFKSLVRRGEVKLPQPGEALTL